VYAFYYRRLVLAGGRKVDSKILSRGGGRMVAAIIASVLIIAVATGMIIFAFKRGWLEDETILDITRKQMKGG